MDTRALSLSPLILHSFENPTCIPRSHNNHHFVRLFSSIHINRVSKTPLAIQNPSPTIPTPDNGKLTTPTLKQLCQTHVPDQILLRMEEVGYVMPTEVQRQALPRLFTGRDCILHAQTGSGKTLTYLLLIYSIINTRKSAVQALVLVPTRELGMQVTKVARILAAKPTGVEGEQKSCTIMALLDGGTLRRQKTWFKAEPPAVVVATVGSLCQMLERQLFSLGTLRVLVVDEVDFLFNSSKQASSLRKILTTYSSCNNRQTVFASASIPHHNRFLHDAVQQKWTKRDVIHIHVSPVEPMPSRLYHRFIVCDTKRKLQTLLSLIQSDAPESGIIFVGEQSEKSKKAGNAPSTSLLIDFLKASYHGSLDILLLEDDMNFNSRAASLLLEKVVAIF
ncbi:DEAD-box ATP-dependent RNA helicase 58, chloroplastic isoform X2 [Cicer arietinum]|uniref:DEAD-box ATP-dependent RNA helicase 58, chloroplastic isoform X2 n=1 Tax=Cicer arietinum TaxID=3827 RepID=UPI003CC502AA